MAAMAMPRQLQTKPSIGGKLIGEIGFVHQKDCTAAARRILQGGGEIGVAAPAIIQPRHIELLLTNPETGPLIDEHAQSGAFEACGHDIPIRPQVMVSEHTQHSMPGFELGQHGRQRIDPVGPLEDVVSQEAHEIGRQLIRPLHHLPDPVDLLVRTEMEIREANDLEAVESRPQSLDGDHHMLDR